MQSCGKFVAVALKNNCRHISTSIKCDGKRNFRKFPIYNKRGTRVVKEAQMSQENPSVPINKRGVRDTGLYVNGKYMEVTEMIPDIIVPDLTNCKLKPYVSYKAPDVVQSEFTSLDLFNAIYSSKIIEDFKEGKLNEDGSSVNPSENEKLTAEEALMRARKSGSDIF